MKTRKVNWVMALMVAGTVGGFAEQTPSTSSTPTPAQAPKAFQPPPRPPSLPVGQGTVLANPAVTPPRIQATPPPTRALPTTTPAQPITTIPGYTPPGVAPTPVVNANPNALKWDAEHKEYASKPGETEAHFTFWCTNVTTSEVFINSVRTSCGCTVAKLPEQPWKIAPNGGGPINVTMNLAGKSGAITKAVTVETSVGTKTLMVKTDIAGGGPAVANSMGDTERLKNMQLALADRQVLFKNQDCAKCHADEAKGKTDGRQIYAAACSVCHESHIRAAMVPDLKRLTHPTMDAEYWRNWVKFGKPGTMMPAFAQTEGGPLSDAQVESLVEFLQRAFPVRRLPGVLAPSPTAQAAPARVQPLPTASLPAK